MGVAKRIILLLVILYSTMLPAKAAELPYPQKSLWDKYDLNVALSDKYKTAVYGDHIEPFTEWAEGWDEKDGKPGEYKYLGYHQVLSHCIQR